MNDLKGKMAARVDSLFSGYAKRSLQAYLSGYNRYVARILKAQRLSIDNEDLSILTSEMRNVLADCDRLPLIIDQDRQWSEESMALNGRLDVVRSLVAAWATGPSATEVTKFVEDFRESLKDIKKQCERQGVSYHIGRMRYCVERLEDMHRLNLEVSSQLETAEKQLKDIDISTVSTDAEVHERYRKTVHALDEATNASRTGDLSRAKGQLRRFNSELGKLNEDSNKIELNALEEIQLWRREDEESAFLPIEIHEALNKLPPKLSGSDVVTWHDLRFRIEEIILNRAKITRAANAKAISGRMPSLRIVWDNGDCGSNEKFAEAVGRRLRYFAGDLRKDARLK